MTFLLPLVALALAFATPFVFRQAYGKVDTFRCGALLLATAVAGMLIFRTAPEADRNPALIGLVLGAIASLLGAWGGGFAFGIAAASALHLLPAVALPVAGLALVSGAGLGALIVGGEASALAAVLVVAADNLGMRHSQVPASAYIGSQLGLAVTVGAFLAGWIPAKLRLARPIVVGIIPMLAGLMAGKSLEEGDLVLCVGIGTLAGIVLHFLMPEEEGESSRVGLAAVIGVGIATVAFGLGKGVGMALAALSAVGVLLAVENRRAVLALGPLVGLTLFRVLREAGTGATRALDIAQHYTLLALVLGLALPLLPTDWFKGRTRTAQAFGGALWGLVAIGAPAMVVVALGMRGAIGFVVGLGVSGLVQAMRPNAEKGWEALKPLALGAGLGGGTILTLSWLGDDASISRDEKVKLFAYAAVAIVIVAGLLMLAGRKGPEEAAQ